MDAREQYMTKQCDTCSRMIHDEDPIVIIAVSVFRDIPSKRSYAVATPRECMEIHHAYCWGTEGKDR